jgi:hypothetical protein
VGLTDDPPQLASDRSTAILLGQTLGPQRERGARLGGRAAGQSAIEATWTQGCPQTVTKTRPLGNDETVPSTRQQ